VSLLLFILFFIGSYYTWMHFFRPDDREKTKIRSTADDIRSSRRRLKRTSNLIGKIVYKSDVGFDIVKRQAMPPPLPFPPQTKTYQVSYSDVQPKNNWDSESFVSPIRRGPTTETLTSETFFGVLNPNLYVRSSPVTIFFLL
jgi:hypothetical protein